MVWAAGCFGLARRLPLPVALCIVLAGTLTLPTAFAQMPGPGQTGLNAAMTKLFGEFTAFSARTAVTMKDKAQNETLKMPMDFSLRDGKIRADVDLGQLKSRDLTPEMATQLKQIGMDKMLTIVRPDKKTTLVVYPALKAYADVPMSKQEADDLDQTYKVVKTKIGPETVDGHACVKYRVTVTNEKGDKNEALVWCATDLKEFPVQMQLIQPEGSVVMLFQNVRLEKPELNVFEAPSGYRRYTSVDLLMQEAMARMMGGGKK